MARLGLDAPTIIAMFKGSIPATIALAMYQAPAVNQFFTNLGYLIPMVTLLAMPMLPRGKYIQNLVLNCLAICISAGVGMLTAWSSIQARIHTTPPGTPPSPLPQYNASQSAVAGVWLFFSIWLANTCRAKIPSLNIPVIIFSAITNIVATSSPVLTTTAQAQAVIKEVMLCMFTGMALATAVNLIVVPVSGRLVIFKEMMGILMLSRGTAQLQKKYLNTLESDDMFAREKPGAPTKEALAAKALAETATKLRELVGKAHADLEFAKREVAWGKLDAEALEEIFKLIRNVYTPLSGITTTTDIFKRVAERRGWDIDQDESARSGVQKHPEIDAWNDIMKQLNEPFSILSQAIDQGLLHAGLCLEIIPPPPAPKKKTADDDIEAKGDSILPGQAGFSKVITERMQAFRDRKGALLRTWARDSGLIVDGETSDAPRHESAANRRERDQARLYVMLYLENLMHSTGEAVQELTEYADRKIEDGTMSKNRLIVPTGACLRQWVVDIFGADSGLAKGAPETLEASSDIVYYGDGYKKRRDPEHLPPTTLWQRIGDRCREVYGILGSEESSFGVRVSLANMTVGIVAFLESTQSFFSQQRLVWAMFVIAMGMSMTSGQSILGLLSRVLGTLIAMVLSILVWYLGGQKIPGVIVFVWLALFITYYFFIKFPHMLNAIIMVLVTLLLILGYELQVVTIGPAAASSNNQPYYPTYELAPYRLASVAGGALVAFIWTVFPSPLTDRTWLRRDVSATLYLLANYFGVINTALSAVLDGSAGDAQARSAPAQQLRRARDRITSSIILLVPSMAQHAEWEKWEPTIGGKFPREAYQEIITRSMRIMGYLTLMGHTVTHPARVLPREGEQSEQQREEEEANRRQWMDALSQELRTIQPMHYTILSTLTLLSNSLLSGQSLPPFMPLPRPFNLSGRLIQLGSGGAEEDTGAKERLYTGPDMLGLRHDEGTVSSILDARNMEKPGYADFAVMQVCSSLVCDDLEGLVRAVSGLVGVVDFSFGLDRSNITLAVDETGKAKGKVGGVKED
ncbi:hypothetical protein GQ53DRAFT_635582 [Thozetella sp. PMI_491]|nr:hypothetical protein GQ53DRAFT_635582 [Thozetella sp. PMI_491]